MTQKRKRISNSNSKHPLPFHEVIGFCQIHRKMQNNKISDATGLSPASVSRVVKGTRFPAIEELLKICASLKLRAPYIPMATGLIPLIERGKSDESKIEHAESKQTQNSKTNTDDNSTTNDSKKRKRKSNNSKKLPEGYRSISTKKYQSYIDFVEQERNSHKFLRQMANHHYSLTRSKCASRSKTVLNFKNVSVPYPQIIALVY